MQLFWQISLWIAASYVHLPHGWGGMGGGEDEETYPNLRRTVILMNQNNIGYLTFLLFSIIFGIVHLLRAGWMRDRES